MNKTYLTETEVPFGTTIDNEGNKASMRSPEEKKEQNNQNKEEEESKEKYNNSTDYENIHTERNPGVGQSGNAD